MTRTVGCEQKDCLLREEGVGSAFIADFVLKTMARDSQLESLMSSRPALVPTSQCLECVRRVMSDQPPISTTEAIQKDQAAARLSWRRHRRPWPREVA